MAFGILTGKSHGLHVAEDESHGDPSSAENTSGMGNRHVRSTSWRLVARSATAAAAAEAEAHAGGAVGGKETDGKEGDATKTDGAPKSPLSIIAPPPATPKATAEAKTPQGKKRLAHEKEYDEQAEALFDALVEAKGAGGGPQTLRRSLRQRWTRQTRLRLRIPVIKVSPAQLPRLKRLRLRPRQIRRSTTRQ